MNRMKPSKKIFLQSAMEYIMTYGWAILIITVVVLTLLRLGVFSARSFGPVAPPGSCHVFRPNGAGSPGASLSGTCNGEVPQYVAQFNGQGGYVNIPDSLANSPAGAVTVSGWFFYRQTGKNVGLIWKNSYNYILYTGEGSYVKFIVWDTTNAAGSAQFTETLLAINGWNYIAGTYDGTSSILYLNGNQMGTIGNGAHGALRDQGGSLVIGKRGDDVSDIYFNGLISNVQVYNASLPASDIRVLYMEGIGGAPIDQNYLIGWWPLNGDANDYSGNLNNGQAISLSFTNQWTNGYTPP
jgi:hypothetical protein